MRHGQELPSIERLRPVLIICGVISAIIVLPLGIANAVVYSSILAACVNTVIAVVLLGLAAFSSYYGFKLLKMVKNMMQPNEIFVKRVKIKKYFFLCVIYVRSPLLRWESMLVWLVGLW